MLETALATKALCSCNGRRLLANLAVVERVLCHAWLSSELLPSWPTEATRGTMVDPDAVHVAVLLGATPRVELEAVPAGVLASLPLGRKGAEEESLLVTCTLVPSALVTVSVQELAASVTHPSCAAECTSASCAIRMVASVRILSASCGPPRLASLSASWFALHSATVTNCPSVLSLLPMTALDVCDGNHTRLLHRLSRLLSRMSTIRRHILAVGRRAAVAAAHPAAAALSDAMQSVRTFVGKGQHSSVSKRAQASAAGAVRTHGGGVACA